MTSNDTADAVISMFDGYKVSYTMAAACQLKLFDLLDQHADGIDANSFAEKNSWNVNATERLLNALVSLQLVEKVSPSVYNITNAGKLLRKNADVTLWGYSQNLHRYAQGFQKILETVKTNPDSSHSAAPAAITDRFKPMHAMISLYCDQLVSVFNLEKYKTVVDLGGGSGSMAYALCRKYPNMSAIVYDMKPVVKVAQSHFLNKQEDLRVSFVAGDFLGDPLPTADLYVIGHVLHDWKDEKNVETALNKVYKALTPGGGVMVMEKCLNETKCGPVQVNMWDLQVMTLCGGRMRSAFEYSALLERSGFVNTEARGIPGMCNYDAVFGHKQSNT